ncbi:hypothetical protein, partial [Amycolatopsis sp. SID8362]|uniref:hypothetical protein n=1 Tax=Amycolatopsis sp. SID8362 TaxID=2690346 RepID=UPI00194069F4
MIGTPGRPHGDSQHNPGFHRVPPRTPRDRRFECALGMWDSGSALTCGELDLGTDPAPADAGPPPGVLRDGPRGEPP